jgi:hypothetical protein
VVLSEEVSCLVLVLQQVSEQRGSKQRAAHSQARGTAAAGVALPRRSH